MGGRDKLEALVAGRKVKLEAHSYGTDCYPNRRWERDVTLADVNAAFEISWRKFRPKPAA